MLTSLQPLDGAAYRLCNGLKNIHQLVKYFASGIEAYRWPHVGDRDELQ